MKQYLKFNSPIHNLQVFLRTISVRYPSIEPIIPDGIYGESTQRAVMAFQKEMQINSTGVVDNSTWDMIVDVYKQTETDLRDGERVRIYPDQGLDYQHHSYYPTVIIMQSMMFALSEIFENIPAPSVNGEIDSKTTESVKAIQFACGLNPDGKITKTFWNFLSGVYEVFVSADRVKNRKNQSF